MVLQINTTEYNKLVLYCTDFYCSFLMLPYDFSEDEHYIFKYNNFIMIISGYDI